MAASQFPIIFLEYLQSCNEMRMKAKLGEIEVSFLVDTGASVSVLTLDIVDTCGLRSCLDTKAKVRL